MRPSPIGLIGPHKVKAYYAGVGGDGHWGRLNLTHQFYQAFGEDEFNGISGQAIDINAQFAAVELSFDKDWLRPRVSFVWASGDDDPDDDEARGFDAILDNPNIAGGSFQLLEPPGDSAAARPASASSAAAASCPRCAAARPRARRASSIPGCCSTTPGSTPS